MENKNRKENLNEELKEVLFNKLSQRASQQQPAINKGYQHCTHLVALGKIYEGSLIVCHVSLTDDIVKVGVSKAIDEVVEVPFPTLEVQFVRQAKNTFIAWARRLVKPI